MKEITLSSEMSYYPVGEHIRHYFYICKEIGDHINAEFPGRSITIWCRGSSGAIIAALISQHLSEVNIFHVKKSGECAHSEEISSFNDINIIVDDLMASGETVKQIYIEMKKYDTYPHCIVMTGVLRANKLKLCGLNIEDITLIGGYIDKRRD